MDDDVLLGVLKEAASAVRGALDGIRDARRPGNRPGQYELDLVADAAALAVLHDAGLRVLSEESGLTGGDGGKGGVEQPLVVLDPVDGSTNASIGLPWFSTSLCVLDGAGPRVALVVNQASGATYEAVRDRGALRDGLPISPSGCTDIATAIIGVSGLPPRYPGWAQFRAMGSAALDHCSVADGSLDGYLPVGTSTLHPWDYLGGMLVCLEAGAVVGELHGNELVVREDQRRSPVAAATGDLRDELMARLA